MKKQSGGKWSAALKSILSTGKSEKVPSKVGEGNSVKADRLCISCPGLVGGNSNTAKRSMLEASTQEPHKSSVPRGNFAL